MKEFPDCSKILPRLYQGAYPPADETLIAHSFNVVVLCAFEYQPDARLFHGLTVLRCPIDDSNDVELTHAERRMVHNTASRVVTAHRSGGRIYVSCWQGRNRSGVVSALAVRQIVGCSGREAREWVRSRRIMALTNPLFSMLLDRLPRIEVERTLVRG